MKDWQKIALGIGGGVVFLALLGGAGVPSFAKGQRVLLVGDSLSVGKRSPGGHLARLLREAGAFVHVNAVGSRSARSFRDGSTKGESAGGGVQLNRDITAHKIKTVLLFLGTNDVANVAEGASLTKTLEAWKELLAFLTAEKVQVIILGPPDFSDKLVYKKSSAASQLPDFYTGLRALGPFVVDSVAITGDLKEDAEGRTKDLIHFEEKAAKEYAERLFFALFGEEPPGAKGSALSSVTRWTKDLEAAIARYSPAVPLALALAVMHVESKGDPTLTSPVGAEGLMQLMPSAQSDYKVSNPFDPIESIDGGIHILSDNLRIYGGDVRLALAAYNAGRGTVEKRQKKGLRGDEGSEAYIDAVLGKVARYSS